MLAAEDWERRDGDLFNYRTESIHEYLVSNICHCRSLQANAYQSTKQPSKAAYPVHMWKTDGRDPKRPLYQPNVADKLFLLSSTKRLFVN